MIKFLVKGLIRDRSRSLFPVLVVIAGVSLTVIASAWMAGYEEELISTTANFNTGHVKVTTIASAKQGDQISNDLAILGVDSLLLQLYKNNPNVDWTPRIRFAGLLDIPNEFGETKDQGPIFGLAINLFDSTSIELKNLNLNNALASGFLPQKPGEILISKSFAQKLHLKIGETATLISSTMHGGLTMQNFTIAGTVEFGITAMDRGAMIADISDMQTALDMPDGAGEILGFFKNAFYSQQQADEITANFNAAYPDTSNEFALTMFTLRDESGLAEILDMLSRFSGAIIGIFLFAMSLVLWNAGLMGSLRRYREIGIRLAIGEHKGHIFRSLLLESIMIGLIGSSLGTALGLAVSYYLQIKGFDISSITQQSSLLVSNVLRAKVSPTSYFIGFIPGLLAMILGTAIAGVGIFKRQTAQLFKELEA